MSDFVRRLRALRADAMDVIMTLRVPAGEPIPMLEVERILDALEAEVTLDILTNGIDETNRFRTYRLVGANEVLDRLAGKGKDYDRPR